MKKYIVILFSLLMLLTAASAEDLSTYTDEELRSLRDAVNLELASRRPAGEEALLICDLGEYHVEVLGVEKREDYTGAPCALVEVSFTNNSSKNTSMFGAVLIRAFQNGIQMDQTISVDDVNLNKGGIELMPGATLNVYQAFLMTDDSAVDLLIRVPGVEDEKKLTFFAK